MFIKLNKVDIYDDTVSFPVYINMDKVEEFFKVPSSEKPFTRLFMGEENFDVKETPEEIMKLIKKAKPPIVSKDYPLWYFTSWT